MTTPNGPLRAARMGLRLSQDDFAKAVRDAGERMGQANDASKRLIQRWESGGITSPRPSYARALEAVTGLPLNALGFAIRVPHASGDSEAGHYADASVGSGGQAMPRLRTAQVGLNGVWLSRYEYFSSGRDATFTGLHFVIVVQHDMRLSVRSLPGSSASMLTMDLTVDGSVITGTWVEQTAEDSYYRGARYHGAIQMLAEPTGRRMSGKWLGFGKDMDVNVGPWELVFQDGSTNKATLDKYNRRPE